MGLQTPFGCQISDGADLDAPVQVGRLFASHEFWIVFAERCANILHVLLRKTQWSRYVQAICGNDAGRPADRCRSICSPG